MKLNDKNIAILDFTLIVLSLLFLNIISSNYFLRLDLTEEKRFTISQSSKHILRDLDEVVSIEIYLDGDLPAGFKRLQRAIRENLDEFRVYSGANIQYKFVDPVADKDEGTRERYFMQLAERGVQPTNLHANEDGKQVEKLIFPGAIMSYRGRETPIIFLKGSTGANPQEALNQSVEGVEFELISAIKKLASRSKKKVGVVEGHGELSNAEMNDIYTSLREKYAVDRVTISTLNNLASYFDVLIIAKPTKYFSEDDKLKLDQFVVRGGKILFLIDKINIGVDSLKNGKGIAVPYDLNLDDLLFKFGVRLNIALYQDLQSGALPMVVGMMGNQPQTQLVPWKYYPVHTQFSNHPIVRNMPAVMTKFIGSIDSVKAVGIRKTPLMFTSKYSKEVPVPIDIDLSEAKKQPDPAEFNSGEHPVGYLLEGNFNSMFTNRLTEDKKAEIDFKSEFASSKLIIFSDGDIIKNDISPDGKQAYPLGFDRFMRKKFANKDLLLNSIDYLCDDMGVIQIRSKEIKLRPLDKQKIKKEKTRWQAINVALPVLFIIIFGVIKFYIRRKKYQQ